MACGRIGYEPAKQPGALDAGASAPDGGASDGGLEDDAGPSDAGRADDGGGLAGEDDGGAADAGVGCGLTVTDVVALYTFDDRDDLGHDAAGDHHAVVVGAPGSTPGPPGCGSAVSFAGVDSGEDVERVEVPNDAAWDLDEGSVDFWFRLDRCGRERDLWLRDGLVMRDASGEATPGHLAVFIDDRCILEARLQGDDRDTMMSAGTVTLGEWHHVAVTFGPAGAELCLDGRREGAAPTTSGIAGNDNPWVFGANDMSSDDGSAVPAVSPMDGALDHVRITSVQHTFCD